MKLCFEASSSFTHSPYQHSSYLHFSLPYPHSFLFCPFPRPVQQPPHRGQLVGQEAAAGDQGPRGRGAVRGRRVRRLPAGVLPLGRARAVVTGRGAAAPLDAGGARVVLMVAKTVRFSDDCYAGLIPLWARIVCLSRLPGFVVLCGHRIESGRRRTSLGSAEGGPGIV